MFAPARSGGAPQTSTTSSSSVSLTIWSTVPASTLHEPADGHLVPLGRVAEVHRQRSAQRDEGLILDALGVARPDSAWLVAD